MSDLAGIMQLLIKPVLLVVTFVMLIVFVVKPFMEVMAEKTGAFDSGGGKGKKRKVAQHRGDTFEREFMEALDGLSKNRKAKLTDQEKIKRLTQSDPERAKDLVKKWLNH